MADEEQRPADRAFFDRAKSAAEDAWRAKDEAVASMSDAVAGLGRAAGERVIRTRHSVESAARGVMWKATDRVAVPTEAMSRFIGEKVQSTGAALIVGAFFPPAIPIWVGYELLTASDQIKSTVESVRTERAEAHEEEKRQRALELDRRLSDWRGLPELVTIENANLRIVIAPETGEAEGMILVGQYAGRSLDDLPQDVLVALRDEAPDDETGKALDAWVARRTSAAKDDI